MHIADIDKVRALAAELQSVTNWTAELKAASSVDSVTVLMGNGNRLYLQISRAEAFRIAAAEQDRIASRLRELCVELD